MYVSIFRRAITLESSRWNVCSRRRRLPRIGISGSAAFAPTPGRHSSARSRAAGPSLIIDCGTGTGRNLDWLSDFGRVIGVERSPTGLRVAHSHRRPVIAGSVTHLPFADGCARVVTSFDVFVTLDDAAEA